MDKAENKDGKASKSKVSENANGLGTNIAASSDDETKQKQHLRNCTSQEKDLTDIVSFQQVNFVQNRHPQDKHYDAILWQVFLIVLVNKTFLC